MFKKKKSPSRELFDDLVVVRKEINRLTAQLEGLDQFDEEYATKKADIESQLARIFEIREIIEEKMLRNNGDIFVGVGYEIKNIATEEPVLVPVTVASKNRAGHFSVQGTTRVGKTVFMLNANIRQNLRARENVICIDPKGGKDQEVFSAMVEFAFESEMLYFFKYFSLAYPELSDRVNPFFGMGHEERASMVSAIASIGNSEQFFTDVVYQLTYAASLCFEVVEIANDPYGTKTQKLIEEEHVKYEQLRQTKGFVQEIISRNEHLKSPDAIDISFATENDESYRLLKEKNATLMNFRDLAKYVTYGALEELSETVFKTTLPDDITDMAIIERFESVKESAMMEIQKILEQPKDFYTKISVSLATLLTQMSQGALGMIFCSVRINPMLNDLSDPNKRLVALIHPFPLQFKKISDMSARIFLLMVENMLGRIGSTGRGFNAKVNVHIDEGASVAYPGIERLPAQAGGLGANLYFYTQSFADWVKALGSKEAANIMMDNLNNQARFRMKDEESASRVVDELGQIDIISSSSMVETDGSARLMMTSEERWFAKTSDVLKMPTGRIIFTTGDKSYLVDTPFWRGPKGSIEMPEISIEKRVRQIREYERSLESAIDSLAATAVPEKTEVAV